LSAGQEDTTLFQDAELNKYSLVHYVQAELATNFKFVETKLHF